MSLPIQKTKIQTARLTLHPCTDQDTDALVRLLTNPCITRTFLVPDLATPQQAEDLARTLIAFSQTDDTAHLMTGIYQSGALIGFVLDCGVQANEIEIGYVIAPDQQGHGYASEAVRAVLQTLREMGFRRVSAGYFVENTASLRVMQKCGMRQSDQLDTVDYRGQRHACRYCELIFA